MAGLFDFEKFYTEKSVKTEIQLDLSGIELKSTASSEAGNDDGSADNVGMNEYVTNNVMYKVARISVNGSTFIGTNDRIIVEYTDADGVSGHEVTITECCPIDVLAGANLVQIPETRALFTSSTLVTGNVAYKEDPNEKKTASTPTGIFWVVGNERYQVTFVTFEYVPRVRLQNVSNVSVAEREQTAGCLYMNPADTNFTNTNQNPWDLNFNWVTVNRALGGLGFYGSRYLGWKWYDKTSTKNRNCVMGYDAFRKRIAEMGKILEPNNMGLKVTYYDDALAEPTYKDDGTVKDAGDWTRTQMTGRTKWVDKNGYYDSMTKFVADCKAKGDNNPLPDLSGNEVVVSEDGTSNTIAKTTAVIPNVSDAFKKFYYPAEDLADEFNDKYFETYRSIMSIRGVRGFMSGSLKRKLSNEVTRLHKEATAETKMSYFVDIASCYNVMKRMLDNNKISYIKRSYLDGNKKEYFRAISNTSGKVRFAYPYNESDRTININSILPVNSYRPMSDEGYLGETPYLYYYNTRNRGLYNQYRDWIVCSTSMTWRSIKQQLCEAFTTMINQKYGLSEGQQGYSKWWYGVNKSNVEDESNVEDFFVDITAIAPNGDAVVRTCTVPSSSNTLWGDTALPNATTWVAEMGNAWNVYSCSKYEWTARHFIDQYERFLYVITQTDVDRDTNYVDPTTARLEDDKEILVVAWDNASTESKVIELYDFEPSYETYDNVGDIPNGDIDGCISFATDVMKDAIDEIDTILSVQGIYLGVAYLLIQKSNLGDAKENYADLMTTINKIRWYQTYTGESVFTNRSYVGDRSKIVCPYLYMPARFMVPVAMYKKVRVKYRRFFRTRHKMVKRSIGVRWVEVAFVDNDVYEAYPQNSNEPRQFYAIGKSARISNKELIFDTDLEGSETGQLQVKTITKFNTADFQLNDADGVEISVEVDKSSRKFKIVTDDVQSGTVWVYGVYLPLDPTNKSDERTPVRVEYKMPYLPYDSEIRRWAFESFGAFDQSKDSSISREVPPSDDKIDGWRIFKPSSKRIGDLRAQLGIYDAASILVGILRNAYGARQVEIVETMRSKDDQDLMCSGSAESTFLSWHNYGLAVKILVKDAVTGLPIQDGSDDMKKLIDIAEGFTTACLNGAFGKPLNVVWCGRLKMGANNFVWEFLPIGINHKDAPKFRDALLNQEDPVASLGFIDVDASGYVYNTVPKDKIPYVLRKSSTYQDALIVNGHHYVSPAKIRNYKVPHDLVLRNVLEFVNLVQAKQGANGTGLAGGASMNDWKALNEKSFKQLIMYYGMIGSLSAAKALVAGDYVEKYRNTVDTKFSENYVAMVQEFLGSLYDDAKIYIESVGDGGAWISVKDGRIHIKTTDLVPDYNPNTKEDFFGEKQAGVKNMKRGLWVNGVFRTEEELEKMGYKIETVSEGSFMEGFENGQVVRGDALMVHSLMAAQIKTEFDKIRDMFENFSGNLMYDHFKDSPNAEMEGMLENEFGLIAGQDLIEFEKLKTIFQQKDINDNAPISPDGTVLGAGANEEDGSESIYEKVVSNAELAGIRKASLTKEHVQVTARANALTTEQMYKLITKGKMTSANDLLSR